MLFKKREIKETKRTIVTTTKEQARNLLPIRYSNSNKGTYGSVLNIAGSANYPGAAFLSSVSALKVGAGLVCLASEGNTISAVSANTPDVTFMRVADSEKYSVTKDSLRFLKDISRYKAISIGCGLSIEKPAVDFVLRFLDKNIKSEKPFIIDADAINALSSANNMPIPANAVVTPHPLELSRLMDMDVEEIQSDRVKAAGMAADYLGCIVVLKGKETVIAAPMEDEAYINPTGNSALAKGGSGDVLTGMVAGFAAQGLKLIEACILAVYLHGKAGELASGALTEYGVLASNLLNHMPAAIRDLQGY